MPNGHHPWRLESGDPPSPAHTSDSEETTEHKTVYPALNRRIEIINANRFLPKLSVDRTVMMRVARFLSGTVQQERWIAACERDRLAFAADFKAGRVTEEDFHHFF